MKALLICTLCIPVFLVSGCATRVWYQPGKTQAEMHKDWAESRLAGQRAGNQLHAPTSYDADVALGLAIRHNRDVANTIQNVSKLTMESKGYQLVPLKSVPPNEPYLKP